MGGINAEKIARYHWTHHPLCWNFKGPSVTRPQLASKSHRRIERHKSCLLSRTPSVNYVDGQVTDGYEQAGNKPVHPSTSIYVG